MSGTLFKILKAGRHVNVLSAKTVLGADAPSPLWVIKIKHEAMCGGAPGPYKPLSAMTEALFRSIMHRGG
jgi:hypothetical protein